MATKVIYRKRQFLNKLGHHSGAFIFAEILRETHKHKNKKTKKKSIHSSREITLSIADCSRIINLDFDLDHIPSANNGLKKLDVLIGILQQFKDSFTKELEVVKRTKKNKPNV